MSLKLYYHPLSSFCHKVLIALYEASIPFEPILVDLGDEKSSAPFRALWPIGKFPVLSDEARDRIVPESTVIIGYLDAHYAKGRFIPTDAEEAWQVQLWDRFYDHYVHYPMQKAVGDNLRPADNRDPYGVEQAKAQMRTAFDIAEKALQSSTWAIGEEFTLADCAAAPALFYGNLVVPFARTHKNLAAYFDRLTTRPSYARALREAEPYFELFPMEQKPRLVAA